MDQGISRQQNRFNLTHRAGVLLLLLGTLFLWINLSPKAAENWWAFFIMAGGLLFMGAAWLVQGKTNGRFPILIRIFQALAFIIFTVAAIFLLNLDWHVWWPLMISTPGLGILFVSFARLERVPHPVETAVRSMSRWVGGTVTLLGGTFLLDQLAIISLVDLFGAFRWWGLFLLPVALGALFNAVRLHRKGHFPAAETLLWLTMVFVGGTAVQEILGANWSNSEGLVGIWLITTGLIVLFTTRSKS